MQGSRQEGSKEKGKKIMKRISKEKSKKVFGKCTKELGKKECQMCGSIKVIEV